MRRVYFAAVLALALQACLSDGTPLAGYESWLRANGYFDAADGSVADGSHAATDGTGTPGDTETTDSAATTDDSADGADDADVSDVAAADLGSAGGCPIVAPGTKCSEDGFKAMGVNFTNHCSAPVKIYWLDQSCSEKLYHDVAPGASQVQSTFAKHIWRIRDAGTGELLKEYTVPLNGALQEVSVP